MATAKYPNQYTIVFAPAPKTDANNPYCKMNVDVLQSVAGDLNKVGALKLWLYLVAHSHMESLGLSQKACEEWGLKKDSYYSGKEELVNKGYLVEIGSNKYEFRQLPIVPVNWDFF